MTHRHTTPWAAWCAALGVCATLTLSVLPAATATEHGGVDHSPAATGEPAAPAPEATGTGEAPDGADHAATTAEQPATPLSAGTSASPTSPTSAGPEADHHHEAATGTTTQAAHTPAWSPGEYDTCPASLHDTYRVRGTDGQLYEGWHPAVVTDPATGAPCTFGHEHGDDPRTSEIYQWAAARLSQDGSGIPMGQVNAASADYAEASDHALAHRHEDHVGSKLFVANDVSLLLADRSALATGADGEPLTCDYLIEFHQGTHSKDALSNNAHQIVYALRCSDGTEAAVQMLTPMGRANEYTEKCSGEPVATSGSTLPDGVGGQRIIPDSECATNALLERSEDVWAMYEVWQTDSVIEMPGGGTIGFDPWFGVRNPGRVAQSATATAVSTESLTLPGLDSFLWGRRDGVTPGSPASYWSGNARDFYLGQTLVTGAGSLPADGVFYTDPYGSHASATPFAGSVRQYVAHRSWAPAQEVERWSSGFGTSYATGSTHTPN